MRTVTYDETKWKLVPMEPTVEMLQAAYRALECEGLVTTTWVRETTYRTMLAAAPDHPAKAGDFNEAECRASCSVCPGTKAMGGDLPCVKKIVAKRADMGRDAEDAARWRTFERALIVGWLPGTAHGHRIKLVEICPMYGDQKDFNNIREAIDAALRASKGGE